MNSALILSGNFRTFDNCIESIEKVIDNFNCDIYICVSDILFNLHPCNKEQFNFYDDKIIDLQEVYRKLSISQKINRRVKKILFFENCLEDQEVKEYILNFDTKKEWLGIDIFKQYYKIKKCIEILKDKGYNYIIKSRFDVEIKRLPDFPLLDNTIYKLNDFSDEITLVAKPLVLEKIYNEVISCFLKNKICYGNIHHMLSSIFRENNINAVSNIEAIPNRNFDSLFDTNITLVTCFYNIKRDTWRHYNRPLELYFNKSENLLNKLNPIVIFTSSEYTEVIKNIRQRYDPTLSYTKIIDLPFEQLKYHDLLETIKTLQNNAKIQPRDQKICPEFCIPEYPMLINNKTNFVYRVCCENYFNSTIFQWVDFGLHGNVMKHKEFDKHYFSNIFYKPGRLRICSFKNPENLNDDYYNTHEGTTAATMFAGDKSIITKFYELTDNEFMRMINNRYINQEQYTYYFIMCKHPELFDTIIFPNWDHLTLDYSKNTIKISLCMSGHLRSYANCRDNIYTKIIEPLKTNGFTVNTLLSTWDNYGFRDDDFNSQSIQKLDYNEFSKIDIEPSRRDFFRKEYSTDNYKRSSLMCDTTSADAVSQIYKLNRVYQLDNDINSDIIIRIRPDIFYNNLIDLGNIKNCLFDNCLYMPEFHNKCTSVTKEMMDHFFFGNKDLMKNVMSMYNNISDLLKNSDCHSTEGLIYEYIIQNKIKIRRFMCSYGKCDKNGNYSSIFN